MGLKFSIITACYNSSKTIIDTIKSVNNQTYKNIEHIFIDGLSSDNTVEIIKGNSKRDNLIISEKDNGLYDAINKGIKNASGDVVGILHSDDLFPSTDIILDLATIFQEENLDVIYGDLQYVNKKNSKKIVRFWKSCKFSPKLLRKGWMPPHPTLFLKTQIHEKHGFFDLTYKISADYDFMLRVFKDSEIKFGYLPKVITKMRTGGASNRSLKNIFIKSKEDYRAIKSNNIGNFITLLKKNISKLKQFI